MHTLYFVGKRLHLTAVARGREMFERVPDMTPARFDLLYLMHRDALNSATSYLPVLRSRLGLARQTVWKLVERLIELGWMWKEKVQVVGRRVYLALHLTELGEKRLKQALDAAFNEKDVLPLKAPAPVDEAPPVPRYWARPELRDDVADMILNGEDVRVQFWGPGPMPRRVPKRYGREVTNLYNKFFLSRQPPALSPPNRRRRRRAEIGNVLTFMHQMAKALGNTAKSIYALPWETTNPYIS